MSEREQLVTILIESIEAILHTLLFVRQLYSPDLFERQRLYGVAVRRARHPDLSNYLREIVASLRAPLAAGTLAKLVVVISDSSRAPVERHVIQPRVLAPLHPHQPQQTLDIEELHSQLRGVILKLQYADSYLTPLPPSCTFEVVAYTSDRGSVPVDTWVEEQSAPGHLELPHAEIVPIKSCAVEGAFQLQVFAESQRPWQQAR